MSASSSPSSSSSSTLPSRDDRLRASAALQAEIFAGLTQSPNTLSFQQRQSWQRRAEQCVKRALRGPGNSGDATLPLALDAPQPSDPFQTLLDLLLDLACGSAYDADSDAPPEQQWPLCAFEPILSMLEQGGFRFDSLDRAGGEEEAEECAARLLFKTLDVLALAPTEARHLSFAHRLLQLLLSQPSLPPGAVNHRGWGDRTLLNRLGDLLDQSDGDTSLLPLLFLLRQHGADINQPGATGDTIMHRMVSGGRIEWLLRWLLSEPDLTALRLRQRSFGAAGSQLYSRPVLDLANEVQQEAPFSTPARLCLEVVRATVELQVQLEWTEPPPPTANAGSSHDTQQLQAENASFTFATSSSSSSSTTHAASSADAPLRHWLHSLLSSLPTLLTSAQLANDLPQNRGEFVKGQQRAIVERVKHILDTRPDLLHLEETSLRFGPSLLASLCCLSSAHLSQLGQDPYSDRFLARVRAMPPRGFRGSEGAVAAFDALVGSHVPHERGDFVYRLFDAILATSTQPQPEGDGTEQKEQEDDDEDEEEEVEEVSSCMAYLNDTFSFITHTARWTPPSCALLVELLTRYGFVVDEEGHDYAWHVLASGDVARVRFLLDQSDSHSAGDQSVAGVSDTSDLWWPSEATGRNLLQTSIRLHERARDHQRAGARAVRELVQQRYDEWQARFWPEVRAQLLQHLIPDLADVVERLLRPPPGLLAHEERDGNGDGEEEEAEDEAIALHGGGGPVGSDAEEGEEIDDPFAMFLAQQAPPAAVAAAGLQVQHDAHNDALHAPVTPMEEA